MGVGPDNVGNDLSWSVMGPPGQVQEVVYDPHAPDRRARVTSGPYVGEDDGRTRAIERFVQQAGKPRRSIATGVIEGNKVAKVRTADMKWVSGLTDDMMKRQMGYGQYFK